ncbi:MAG TPA: GNAT family N-acetyltransferase [Anaerolineales bacterium]|nr:GNAT family N-acetyltransferase [Anaerolineales bacterium]
MTLDTVTLTINTLATPTGYNWRPWQLEDIPNLFALLLAAGEADDRQIRDTAADMETQFVDPWSDPTTCSLAAFTPEGQAVATARTYMNPNQSTEARCYFDVEVHPAHRGQGLEDFVLEWAEAQGRERLSAAPARLPRRLMHGVQDTLAEHIARLERHGFSPIRYFYRMRRDLSQLIPDRPLPEGLSLRRFAPEMGRPLLDAFNESFRDHWNFEPVSAEEWEMFFIKRSSFRPDLSFLVMDGGDITGFSFNTVSTAENSRNKINEGWVGELGTRRGWRKRGVASALLCESMRAFKADGLDYATLGVDTQNPSGALGLYEGLGFEAVKRFIMFAKPVD